ncbi:MAG: hypothetical protein H7Y33_14430 [Cytophagales bacterium]|nr:hypothetical protein [Rhizobacter sp.]
MAAWFSMPAAQAQDTAGAVVLDKPQSPLHCLTPAVANLAAPVYPPDSLYLNNGGMVRVRLTFRDAAKAPDVEIVYATQEAMADAVRDRVREYRLPCLPEGVGPVLATQLFDFNPHDGRKVFYGKALDDAAPTQPCRFTKVPDALPRFPAYSTGLISSVRPSGTVLMRMTFTDKDKPPATKVLFSTGGPRFVEAVEFYAQDYRLDCPTPYAPVDAKQVFHFRMEGEARYGLKNLSLQQFVGAMDRLSDQHVRFNLDTMKCPFDLRLRLLQPHAENDVGEVASSEPSRREFIEWLRGAALKLPAAAYEQVIGNTITVTVPCGTLDLS